MEKTLVIIKPDAVKRKLIGHIIQKYEEKGLVIEEMKMLCATDEILAKHYEEHLEKPFYHDLLEFMKSGPMVVLVLVGEQSIETVRKIHGATDPLKAENGSIRGQYAYSKTENCVHGSDSVESARRECAIWFE